MNLEIAAKWEAALLSGEYPQAKGALNVLGGGMCCLGVLCELYRKETGNGYWEPYTDCAGKAVFRFCVKDSSYLGQIHKDSNVPPQPVLDWAGMASQNPDIPGSRGASLASENDFGSTFPDLAAVIKTHAVTF
jgi:hypothetical protein